MPRGPANPAPEPASPDETVDFALEMLRTPDADLRSRVRRLSPDLCAAVLVEVVRRFRELEARLEASGREADNLRYHAKRLEEMLLDAAKRKTP